MSTSQAGTAEDPRAQGRLQSCPNCGAPVEFDPKNRALGCEHCNTWTPMPPHGRVEGHGLDALEARPTVSPLPGRKTVVCGHCGATASIGEAELTAKCIYCLSALSVSTDAQPTTAVDAIVPFRMTREEARDVFRKWLSEVWFAPNALTRLAKVTKLRATYTPSWIFSAAVQSKWSARAGFLTSAKEDREAGRIRPKGDQGHVRMRWEDVSGTRFARYDGLVTSASRAISHKELRSIEPFELDQALSRFDPGFLAGFDAEYPYLTARQGWGEAQHRMKTDEEYACEREVPGDEMRRLRVEMTTSDESFVLALLPVFVVAYDYRGEVFRVLVNGRTGKTEGDHPISPWKMGTLLAFLAAIAGWVIWLLN